MNQLIMNQLIMNQLIMNYYESAYCLLHLKSLLSLCFAK